MKHVILLLILLLSSIASGQYFNAKIDFTDGTTKTGYAKVPRGMQKKIKFRNSPEEKVTKLNGDDIFTITFTVADGRTYLLERNEVKTIVANKKGEILNRTSKWSGWFLREHSNPKLNFYYGGHKYKINENGDLTIKSSGQVGFTEIGYYLRRPHEKEVTYITAAQTSGIQVNMERIFRNVLSVYLSDNRQLAERIKNKEFKSHQLKEIYNSYIAGKG